MTDFTKGCITAVVITALCSTAHVVAARTAAEASVTGQKIWGQVTLAGQEGKK